ncbi:hypothetical protein FOZ63_019952, partial [Perkinsus olseni]
FCRDHGMLRKENSSTGKFVPTLYGHPVCWDSLAWFFGVSKTRINEIAKMAKENIKHVKPRYEMYSVRQHELSGHAFVCDFLGHVFRSIGEYQPDTCALILPFATRVLLCQYLRAKWEDQAIKLCLTYRWTVQGHLGTGREARVSLKAADHCHNQ